MTVSRPSDVLASARRVADAVLYEGYVLYPYRASAAKNHYRWQFGVVVPASGDGAGGDGAAGEPSEVVSSTLLRAEAPARVTVVARFLTLRRRQVQQPESSGGWRDVEELEAGEQLHVSWDEGVEREVVAGPLALDELVGRAHEEAFALPGGHDVEVLHEAGGIPGRVKHVAEPVEGVVRVRAVRLAGAGRLAGTEQPARGDVVRLEVVVRNTTGRAEGTGAREAVLRRSLVGLHMLLSAERASFASLIDPPAWAADHVAGLDNRHTYPVLAGPAGGDEVVLSAPIILPDHPEIAGESAGESYDATEIDELLTLAVRSLTEEEKRQARATDPRAAELVDRAEHLPGEVLERLHGAIRQFEPLRDPGTLGAPEPFGDFFGVGEPPRSSVAVDGRTFHIGDRVRLVPRRRADAQDLFAAGRSARLERIETDLEGNVHLAVTLVDDPGADLHAWSRRFLYFQPDEVELLER